jgi:mannosyltransferase OCH1-like enzyme
MIPRVLHFIWIGDESRRPDNCIETWRTRNPAWRIRIWGNAELFGRKWRNSRHMSMMAERELNGVADLMRYEILHEEGGFAVDADSVCIRPLENWLFEPAAFACWENELARPGLLATCHLAAARGDKLMEHVIADIHAEETVVDRLAWRSTGPQRLTEVWRKTRYADLTIYPSHFFIPEHYCGARYSGPGPVFATHLWAGTRGLYATLHQHSVTVAEAPAQPAARRVG